jgi:hypothetical protein
MLLLASLCVLLALVWHTHADCAPHRCHTYVKYTDQTQREMSGLKEAVKDMFYHGYNSYLEHAYPLDELCPLSCSGW